MNIESESSEADEESVDATEHVVAKFRPQLDEQIAAWNWPRATLPFANSVNIRRVLTQAQTWPGWMWISISLKIDCYRERGIIFREKVFAKFLLFQQKTYFRSFPLKLQS